MEEEKRKPRVRFCGKCQAGWLTMYVKPTGECPYCDRGLAKACSEHNLIRPCICNKPGIALIKELRGDLMEREEKQKELAHYMADDPFWKNTSVERELTMPYKG